MSSKVASAEYNETTNELEVVREGENIKRYIRCTNFNPSDRKNYGIEIHGDEIWLLSSPKNNSKPNRKHIYFFKSLSSGGYSEYKGKSNEKNQRLKKTCSNINHEDEKEKKDKKSK